MVLKCTTIQLRWAGDQEAGSRSRGSADSRSRSRGKVGNHRSGASVDTAESLVSTAAVVGRNSRSRSRHRSRGSADETPADPDDVPFYGAELKGRSRSRHRSRGSADETPADPGDDWFYEAERNATVVAEVEEQVKNRRSTLDLRLLMKGKTLTEFVILACEGPLACGHKEVCGVLDTGPVGFLDPGALFTNKQYWCVRCGGELRVKLQLEYTNGEIIPRPRRLSCTQLGLPES